MAMLAEGVELVIGVDTHKHTHTAAAVTAATVPASPDGDQHLLRWADRQPGRRSGRSRGPAATVPG